MKRDIAIQAGIYVLCVALVSFLWHRPVVLFVCYLAVSVLMLGKWHTKSDLTFYLVGFVLGPAGEIVIVHFGAWQYAKPFYLLPIWLPFIWGIFALLVKKISETLVQAE